VADLNPFTRSGPISSGALNLTLGSGVVAAVIALADLYTPDFITKILGADPPATARASVFIAVVASWAAIAVSDILARAYASAHQQGLAVMPSGMMVSRPALSSADESGWNVIAVSASPDDASALSYLVAKSGRPPEWVKGDQVTLG
jgi:hypothetical protein